VSRFLRVSCALVLAFLALPTTGRAQRTLPLDRLPANTYAVLIWHGQAAIAKGAATNNLVRLWNDPDFLPVRRLFSEALATSEPGAKPLSKADQDAMLEVVSNPAIIGAAGTLDLARLFDDAAAAAVKPAESDFFVILDTTGKEAHWRRLDARETRATTKVTTLKLKGIDVRRSESEKDLSFAGTVGSWRVEAGRQALFEDLVERLQAASAPASSLIQSPLYAEAQRFRADSVLAEFLVKMPDLSTVKSTPGESFNAAALLRGLKLERVRGLVGSIGLAGSATLMRSALLGDTSAGSLFDLFGSSTTTFGTLPAAPAGHAYNATKLDFGAFYRTLRAAMKSAMPPDQFGNLEMVESMVAAEMQVPLADLLASIEEVATIKPTGAENTDFSKVMFALRLKRTSDLLALLKKGLGEMIAGETIEGGTTYLSLAMGPTTVHVAAGPQLLVVAPTRELARAAMTRAAAGTPQPGSLAADAGFQKGRALFPPALTSLAYSDMGQTGWQALFGELASAVPESTRSTPGSERVAAELTRLLPPLLTKYLRTSSSAGWKTPAGMFFEGRID
jgi:hypothetical protein